MALLGIKGLTKHLLGGERQRGVSFLLKKTMQHHAEDKPKNPLTI